jgi:hypothetical protein
MHSDPGGRGARRTITLDASAPSRWTHQRHHVGRISAHRWDARVFLWLRQQTCAANALADTAHRGLVRYERFLCATVLTSWPSHVFVWACRFGGAVAQDVQQQRVGIRSNLGDHPGDYRRCACTHGACMTPWFLLHWRCVTSCRPLATEGSNLQASAAAAGACAHGSCMQYGDHRQSLLRCVCCCWRCWCCACRLLQ